MKQSFVYLIVCCVLWRSLFSSEMNSEKSLNILGSPHKVSIGLSAQGTYVYAHQFTEEKKWSDPFMISHEDRTVISAPLFEINSLGGAAALWQSRDSSGAIIMEAAFYDSRKGWCSSIIISDPHEKVIPGDYELRLDDTGAIFFLWTSEESTQQVNKRSAVGSFELWPPQMRIHE